MKLIFQILIVQLMMSSSAFAEGEKEGALPIPTGTTIGPLLVFEELHRQSPEQTWGTRLGGGLYVNVDLLPPKYPEFEFFGMYLTGKDEFATQNVMQERIWRFRTGFLQKIFSDYFGFRAGIQYSLINSIYLKHDQSSEVQHPRFWSGYAGINFSILPNHGFGITEQITVSYEPFYKTMIYQLCLGILIQ